MELAGITGEATSAPAAQVVATPARKKISAAGIAKIKAAQKLRWAKIKAAKKLVGKAANKPALKTTAKKSKMSAAARAKIAAAARARWAAVKAAGKKKL